MGGFGSGRRADCWDERRKPLVEDALTLDAAGVDWKGLLERQGGTLRWMKNGQETASMGYRVKLDEYGERLLLRYTARDRRGHFPVADEIPLEETTPHFGGRRIWFSCPGCGRRVRTLHIPKDESLFRCRDCHGLTYRSVREHDKRVDELVREPWKVRAMLEGLEGAPMTAFTSQFFLAMKAISRLPCA